MKTIGFIGLGTIGGTIAKNLQLAGYPLVVHDIRPEAAVALAQGGAQVASSAAAGPSRARRRYSACKRKLRVSKCAVNRRKCDSVSRVED
jgi:3-hydroxyacyl-CoA dehydrogenase